jgi:hypothetical protein
LRQSFDLWAKAIVRIAQAGIPTNEAADRPLVHDPFENGVMLGVRT